MPRGWKKAGNVLLLDTKVEYERITADGDFSTEDKKIFWNRESIYMKQPTIEEISKKIVKVLDGVILREEVCEWAIDFIRNDDKVEIDDIKSWHYLVEISNIDEMIEPDVYLFDNNDIRDIMKKYS